MFHPARPAAPAPGPVRQRIQVRFSHAGQTVTGNGEITRFKAYGTWQPG